MQRQTCSSVCLHCCQKSLHTSGYARTIHWTLYSSASKPRERQRERETGGMESTLKSCQVFFCLHFFIFLWLMETSQMPVSDRLIFFLNSFQMKDKSTYAFGENKYVTWSYCWSVLCHVMNMQYSEESSQQQSAAIILFSGICLKG